MQPALEQNSGAAELQLLYDFFVDFCERQNIGVLGTEWPVEGAERTILSAEIRIVNVAVDLVSDDAGIVFLQAHLVRIHADADEVIGFEHVESLLFRQCHDNSLFRLRINSNQSILRTRMISLAGRPYNFTVSASARLGRRPLQLRLSQPSRPACLARSNRVSWRGRNIIPGRGDSPRPKRNRCCVADRIRARAVTIPVRARRQSRFPKCATNRNRETRESPQQPRE